MHYHENFLWNVRGIVLHETPWLFSHDLCFYSFRATICINEIDFLRILCRNFFPQYIMRKHESGLFSYRFFSGNIYALPTRQVYVLFIYRSERSRLSAVKPDQIKHITPKYFFPCPRYDRDMKKYLGRIVKYRICSRICSLFPFFGWKVAFQLPLCTELHRASLNLAIFFYYYDFKSSENICLIYKKKNCIL